MGNWLAGESSGESPGWSPGHSSGGSSVWSPGWPSGVSLVPAHKLDEYIQANLKPNEGCLRQIDQAADAICAFLRSNGISVEAVAKGGSYGRKTVLRGFSDGTLVLFMGHFQQFQDQKKNQYKLLDLIEQLLKNHEKYKNSVNRGDTLEVAVSIQGQKMLLQLLPAFNPLCFGENPSSRVYRDLKKAMDQAGASPGEFAACFTTLQQQFFDRCPRKLKDLILLVKYWYQECQQKWTAPPPLSLLYALELLTVYAWEQGCREEDFDVAEGVRTVLHLIRQSAKLCVYWTDNYNFEDETVRNTLLHQLRSQRPIILDPTDPTNNVGREDVFWQLLTEEAQAWLSSPSLNVSPGPCWNVLPAPLFITPSHLLDKFIGDFLQPNKVFLEQIKRAVDIICSFLKEHCFRYSSTNVLKVIKGGSSAKGTALKNGSDADIVVFLSSLNSYRSQKTERSLFVQEIRKQLEACQQAYEWEVEFEISKWEAPRVLSFTLKSKHLNESVDFDVLPAYDALGQLRSGFTSRPKAYKELIELCASPSFVGGEFSTCFTELQRNFIEPRPTKLKSLLRLVKHWYKQCERKMKAKPSLPPKYALELLTVYAWEQGSGMNDFDTAEGFRTVLDLVIKYQQLCIFWTVNYDFQDEPMRTFLLTQIQKKRPVILDPADPTGDVGGGDRWSWHLLAKEAKGWLSSLCFQLPSRDLERQRGLVQPWKVPVVQTPGSCGAQIYPTVGGGYLGRRF
ncbi:2'-5'-oligoadenylate synthase 2 isoform X2 [Psammomys obesus]|uniref:2'-5'-oligoadenylate synthase 2 isoform X2 n=1 Tax=Psammomys obesus TaxID=48139 RepID=UPI0024533ED3|nr:2'-5'-oligoadenylate synthase 2 isoform X2 [Psammomys obesus]